VGGYTQHRKTYEGSLWGVVNSPLDIMPMPLRKKFYFFVTIIFLTFEGRRVGIDIP